MLGQLGSPRYRTASLAALMLGAGAVVTLVDLAAGASISLSSVYVVFVVAAAWEWGRLSALLTSLLSVGAALLSNHAIHVEWLAASEPGARPPGALWWTALARLVVYALVGLAVSTLRAEMRERDALVAQLRQALAEIRVLEGLLPICAWCKRIRDEEQGGVWLNVESYIARKTSAQFTHGICPECVTKIGPTDKEQ